MDSSIRMIARVANDAGDDASFDPIHFELRCLRQDRAADAPELCRAYQTWDRVWSATLAELDGLEKLDSDEFSRQHEILALFYGSECVAMTAMRWIDFRLPFWSRDTYFGVWPSEIQERILEEGPAVTIVSNLTVLPEWRGAIGGFAVKDIMMGLSVRRFLAGDGDLMLGTPRVDRGVHGVTARLGATALVDGATLHGVKIDLVAWIRKDLGERRLPPATAELVDSIWEHCQQQEQRRHANRTQRAARAAQSRF